MSSSILCWCAAFRWGRDELGFEKVPYIPAARPGMDPDWFEICMYGVWSALMVCDFLWSDKTGAPYDGTCIFGDTALAFGGLLVLVFFFFALIVFVSLGFFCFSFLSGDGFVLVTMLGIYPPKSLSESSSSLSASLRSLLLYSFMASSSVTTSS